ncbi:type II and III secretion system protein family protein [Novosphingobium sp.]|uniref:type II and III secretion system protein family protein n=1 Tax=Novosphingobium sp. TaxID=1874826 RepID=UPI00273312CE|nr:type II and III secretion system protein family protein [Novosphingobium sp.]MDP3908079.1 type II and III secretion system protein family protein [Novosphingobium sp.]
MKRNPIHAACGAQKGTPMKRLASTILSAACLAAPLALLPVAAAQAQSVSRPASDVVLSIGRGQLITVGGAMADVFVANDSIADVQVKSQRQLYVFGKAGGETTVYASNAAGDIIWSANVRVGSNIESVDQMLRLAMPDAKIAVSTMGTNTFLLTGTIGAPEDAAEAQRLVEAYVGKDANVISRLKMSTPLQVNLQVRFAEVSRSLVKEFSSNLATRDLTGGFSFGMSRGRTPGVIGNAIDSTMFPRLDASTFLGLPAGSISLPYNPQSGQFIVGGTSYSFAGNQASQTALGLAGKLFGMDILAGLDMGEKVGLVTTLSNPNLTALSGETAEFLAGGEYPIPISQGLGTTSVEYKKYGVSLAYTPFVLANGRISLRVRPEVSELSSQGAITINGFQVPALTVRRAETTIELGSGQSFMIAGLMSNSAQNTVEKMPGAGDLPILGSLFRSTNFRRGETELVIIVTPYLVNPVDANDIKLPTDGYQSPDDIQRVLGNMGSDGKMGAKRPVPTVAPDAVQAPRVGELIEPAAPAAVKSGDKKPRRSKTRTASAEAAAPGFGLN